ncbi:hypothetical protein C0993_003546 [Termitomyces sp. T159_Od127]|nr:hypothetical protein C0993_003546 [Termitomyces sp. T159_Od127]
MTNMCSTSHSLLSILGGKDPSRTGSHIFAAIFTATTFTLHVVQSYFFTPVANVKYIPLLSPTPQPSPAAPTKTRPLTPTRSSDFVDSRADASYLLFSLILVLLVILASAGSTFLRTKSKSTVTPNIPPQEQEPEQDPPPNIPPQRDEGSSDDIEDREDSHGEEREDGAGEPEDKPGDEGNDEQENGNDSACISDSPGGEPDDPSGSSNVGDLPPSHFEPDPSDVLALALLYIVLVTYIIRHALAKHLVLKTAAKRLFTSAISIMPHVLHKYFVLETATKRLFASAFHIIRHAFRKYFVLSTVAKRLFTSAISIRSKASEFFEHALHRIDARSSWIENVGVSMSMEIADVDFWNNTREIENAIASVASQIIMMDELRGIYIKPTVIEGLLVPSQFDIDSMLIDSQFDIEPMLIEEPLIRLQGDIEPTLIQGLLVPSQADIEPTLIEEPLVPPQVDVEPTLIRGLLVPISSQPSQTHCSVPPQFPKLLEPMVQLPCLPLPTLEEMDLPSLSLPSVVPAPEIQDETSEETVSNFLEVLRATGWGTAASIVCQVVMEWRRRRRGAEQLEPEVEVVTEDEDEEEEEDEDEEEENGTTAWEQSSNDVTLVYLDAHEFEVETDAEEVETNQHSDVFECGFVTAQEIDVTIDTAEPAQEARPILPTITVSPSFDIPSTPERAIAYPSGTPSFVGVLTSSTLRHMRREGTESRPPTSPAIAILISAPDTPEQATAYPIGTPSFADVLTSSVLRPARRHEVDSELRPSPSFTHSPFPVRCPTNDPSFADATTPVTFPFEYQCENGSDTDNAFILSSFALDPTLQSLESHGVSLSLCPVLLRKHRRLNEADKDFDAPSFNGVTTSSPAVDHNRRWLVDEIGFPTRTDTSTSTSRSMSSLNEGRGGNTTDDESEPDLEADPESESEPTTDSDNVFNTYPSLDASIQHSQRLHVKKTEDISLINRKSISHFVLGQTDEESDVAENEVVVGVEEQVREELGEKDMEIEDEDHSAIRDLEADPFDLTPRPTPAFIGTRENYTSEDDQTIPDQLTPRPTLRSVDDSFVSEGNEIFDPDMIAQGAAQMLRLLQEDMEREKLAKEEAAREKKRAKKMKMRESPESKTVRGEPDNGTRRKYIGPLEALKQDRSDEMHLKGIGGFMQDEVRLRTPVPCRISSLFHLGRLEAPPSPSARHVKWIGNSPEKK